MDTTNDPIFFADSQIGLAGEEARHKFNTFMYGLPFTANTPGYILHNQNLTKQLEYPYCGTFVSWCFAQAGIPLGVIDYTNGYASVPNAAKHYIALNLMTKEPVRNCIVFYNWQGNLSNTALLEHTGIFEHDNGDGLTFTAIEGNTSGQGGDQSNGGCVFRKIRYYSTALFANPLN